MRCLSLVAAAVFLVAACNAVPDVEALELEEPAIVLAQQARFQLRKSVRSTATFSEREESSSSYKPPVLNASVSLFLDSTPDQIAFTENDPSVMFLINRNRFMRSGDFGVTWKVYSDSDLPGLNLSNSNNTKTGIRSFYRSDANPNQIIVLGYGDSMWASNDSGLNFTALSNQGTTFNDIVFHSILPNYVIAAAQDARCNFVFQRYCAAKLFYSTNLGHTWSLIVDKAYQYYWGWGGLSATRETDSIYYLTDRSTSFSSDRKELYKFTIESNSTTFIMTNVTQFLPISSYFFVVTRSAGRGAQSKIMVAWRDQPFKATTFDGRDLSRIALLDASEDMVFALDLQRDNATKTNSADLYISAEYGARYSLSLRDVLYYERPLLVEFHRVASLDGVFLANIVNDDYSLRSLITYNKGGYWEAVVHISRGTSVPATLNLGSFHVSVPVLTGSYAPGMAVAYGTLQTVTVSNLNITSFDMMLSQSGGRYWDTILPGAHICDATDEGDILVCVPEEASNYFTYSLNKGIDFQTVKYDDRLLTPAGIFCDPIGNTLGCTLLTKYSNDSGFAITPLQFAQLGIPDCPPDAYEIYTPTDGRAFQRCVLGLSVGYMRRKAEVICVSSVDRHPQLSVRCLCEQHDFECDYGYSGNPCVAVSGFNATPSECDATTRLSYIPSGYRRIPGDLCYETATNPDLSKPIEIPCDPSKVSVSTAVGLGVTLPLVAFLGAGVAVWYVRKRRSPYRYSTLATQTEASIGTTGENGWQAMGTSSALLLPRESDLMDIDRNKYEDAHFDLVESSDPTNDIGAIPLESLEEMHIVSLK